MCTPQATEPHQQAGPGQAGSGCGLGASGKATPPFKQSGAPPTRQSTDPQRPGQGWGLRGDQREALQRDKPQAASLAVSNE